jgi:RecA-family ATPase
MKCLHCKKETENNKKYCSDSCKSLAYYYKNKEKVLKYQTERWKKKYQTDEKFRKKRQFRDKSRIIFDKLQKLEGMCINCGTNKDLQRHHQNYEDYNYIIVCKKCHDEIHRKLKC